MAVPRMGRGMTLQALIGAVLIGVLLLEKFRMEYLHAALQKRFDKLAAKCSAVEDAKTFVRKNVNASATCQGMTENGITLERLQSFSSAEVQCWACRWISEEDANKLANEDIDGKALILLSTHDFKDLGIKLGNRVKLREQLDAIKGDNTPQRSEEVVQNARSMITPPGVEFPQHAPSKAPTGEERRNMQCREWISSSCKRGDTQYVCTQVPGTKLLRHDTPSPREECLGGSFSWGACAHGRFLCRRDKACEIAKGRQPVAGMQQCAVSTRHGFIYIHVPKAGGSSMHAFLRGALCRNTIAKEADCDEEELRFLSCREALQQFPKLFKFSFVRHPYPRAISAYIMATGRGFMKDNNLFSFDEWLKEPEALQTKLMGMHWYPMHWFLYTVEGCPVADFVGRQKTFESDLRIALQRIGSKKLVRYLDRHGLPHDNRAEQYNKTVNANLALNEPKSTKDMRDRVVLAQQLNANAELKALIQDRFWEDFKFFDFHFDETAADRE